METGALECSRNNPHPVSSRPPSGGDVLFMGPEPYLAHCVGCGRFVEQPPLPAPMAAVLAYLAYAAALHARCHAPLEAR